MSKDSKKRSKLAGELEDARKKGNVARFRMIGFASAALFFFFIMDYCTMANILLVNLPITVVVGVIIEGFLSFQTFIAWDNSKKTRTRIDELEYKISKFEHGRMSED